MNYEIWMIEGIKDGDVEIWALNPADADTALGQLSPSYYTWTQIGCATPTHAKFIAAAMNKNTPFFDVPIQESTDVPTEH